ncbi:unnamed protein product [Bursaphelenchus xylophilus]|uniref:(pine wood nematode) hypothetical protein n=1 Tax=Bursaphelenchus xylophilus TaxID=6326 RepID=A0A7I8XFJ1_BURXY|nr:unnamed protein product [Bursaphelenchus xylophilus]CAG9124312.1 unnamed protein product [Bursaphelenchus xylophilus]
MTEPGAIQGLVKDTIDRLRNVDRLIHGKNQNPRTSDPGIPKENRRSKTNTSPEQLIHDKENRHYQISSAKYEPKETF